MSNFTNIEHQENDCLLLNPLIIQESEIKKPDCTNDGNFKIKNALSELQTETQKAEARKNLGLDNLTIEGSGDTIKNFVVAPASTYNILRIETDKGNKYVHLYEANTTQAGLLSAPMYTKLRKYTNESNLYKLNFDGYISEGTYNFEGIAQISDPNSPILNTGLDASFAAKLFVTVSPEGQTVYRSIIGQTLILSNAEGHETKIYTRSANKTSYDGGVTYETTWGEWSVLQGMREVGLVSSFDSFIDNGMYSGIYGMSETFVLVTINNYLIASMTSQIHVVSQFKYSQKNSIAAFEHRSGRFVDENNIAWTPWQSLQQSESTNSDGVTSEQLQELLAEMYQWVVREAETRESIDAEIKSDSIQASSAHFTSDADSASLGYRSLSGIAYLHDIPTVSNERAGILTAALYNDMTSNVVSQELLASLIQSIQNEISDEVENINNQLDELDRDALLVGSLNASSTSDTVIISGKSKTDVIRDAPLPVVSETNAGILTAALYTLLSKESNDGLQEQITALNVLVGAKIGELLDTLIKFESMEAISDSSSITIIYTNGDAVQTSFSFPIASSLLTGAMTSTDYDDLVKLRKLFLKSATSSTKEVGMLIFESGKPYWWTGEKWVDAMGNVAPF